MNCSRCNRRVAFVQRWNSPRWVCCEVEFDPAKHYRESFVEVEPAIFVSVFRHECESEIKEPYKYKPINEVFRGSAKFRAGKHDQERLL